MFGAAAEVFGAEENPGRKLLDKSMSDWTAERDKNLARLEKQANQSTGLQRTFWREYGDEIKAKKELQDAAAYLSVADKIDALNEQKKGQISAKAAADNAKASAEYRQKAAEKHQAVVDDRFKDNKVVSGGTTTETISNKPAAGGANGEGRSYGVKVQKATLYEKGKDALDTIDELHAKKVFLTDEDRQKILRNRRLMEKADHGGFFGFTQAIGATAAKPYEGLSPDKQRLAQSLDLLAQVGAGVTSTSTAEGEIKHARDLFDMTGPGQSDAAIAGTLDKLRGVVGSAKSQAGSVATKSEAGAHAMKAAAPGGASSGVRQTRRFPDGSTHTGTLLPNGSFQVD
jgi:hypothetical protein